MAERAPPAAPAGAPGNAEGPSMLSQIVKYGALYFAMQAVLGKIMPKPAVSPSTTSNQAGASVATVQPVAVNALPAWPVDSPLSLHVYLNDGHIDFSRPRLPFVSFHGFSLGDQKFHKTWETTFATPEAVKHNASLWADMFLTKEGASPDPRSSTYSKQNVAHSRKLLTRYHKLRKQRLTKNLFSDTAESVPEDPEEVVAPIVGHWHSNLTLTMVCEDAKKGRASLPVSQLPPQIKQYVHLDASATAFDESNDRPLYLPIIFPNDFWLMREHMHPINDTVNELSLRLEFTPISFFKFQMFATLDDAFNKQATQPGGAGGAELDEIKHMLTQTNPVLLVTTIIVSILHMVFEFLAFKSDVGHWRGKKELTGVSVRTIVTNVVVQLVIMLYLLDNNENTSLMILGGQVIGVAIEAWKITKAVDIRIVSATSGILPYRLDIRDKHVLTEEEKRTQEYDKLAFRYVTWGTAPFLVGYTIYSMLFQTHRSWYSFVISTLVSFIYMFGFVQLIPQLIINYKLKSVAHMPLKSLTYKALNTVVDDFFSFVVRMPLLHRLACFRDDVVFVILLYQDARHILLICFSCAHLMQPTRANEFGQVAEEPKRVEGTTETAAQDKAEAVVESRKDR